MRYSTFFTTVITAIIVSAVVSTAWTASIVKDDTK